ncbi:T9SS type A sorting domain-containing protein [Flavobacterium sp. ENC]|uniref:DUF7619 domain-containing protein n=1 Tax=Flavobacterium sp. ENC TaxID=2897330 RepID=UPI001E41E0B0|nr:T9SS type A sorting domain-containing protein [Flavobacterium sp. ENC]MCD0465192.1 T9SS type A sorting domain-containing protein [Flavobacterium sp. ENC]
MKKLYFSFLFFVFILVGLAQNPSDRDPTFNAYNLPLGNYFIDSNVYKTMTQPDGKMLVIKTAANNYKELIRLTKNSLDSDFRTGTGFNSSVTDIEIQPDGKILVVGDFSTYNQTAVKRVVRLNSDGSSDKSFILGSGITFTGNYITAQYALELQPDGKILITGDSATSKGVVRLNPDGSVDTSFTCGVIFNAYSSKIALQPDGKIIVTGTVTEQNVKTPKIVRLNQNGTLDAYITPGTGTIESLHGFASQPDGKILFAATLTSGNSTLHQLIRLNSDLSVDASFKTDDFSYLEEMGVAKILVQPDGKIVLCGTFFYPKLKKRRITRLNADGSQDETFKIGDAADFQIRNTELLPDGKIVLAGDFKQFNYITARSIMILNADGTIDNSFHNHLEGIDALARTAVVLSDDKILLGGDFLSYNGITNTGLIRLNKDGSQDESLTFGGLRSFNNIGIALGISTVASQPDGKILVGGNFTSFNWISTEKIVRLNYDGTRDNSFAIGSGFNYEVKKIVVQPDGKILAAGDFTTYKGNSQYGLVRLNSDGSADPDFKVNYTDMQEGQMPYNNDIKVLPDGKILLSSTSFKTKKGLVRLNSNGSEDTSFVLDPNVKIGGYDQILTQIDGKIICQGTYNTKSGIFRLTANGSIDNSFNYVVPADVYCSFVGIQSDDKILVTTTKTKNIKDTNIIRLNSDGSTDPTFGTATIDVPYGYERGKVLPQSDGKLIYYGFGTSYNSVPAGGIIRLLGQDFKFVKGTNRLDADHNGCDINDISFAHLKMKISSGTNTTSFVGNSTGNYLFSLPKGTHTVTPVFQNPSYFTVDPSSFNVDFPAQASPFEGNFCITPNGVHSDLEITILPLVPARPGFDAKYKIVYTNKGNQKLSGTVSLTFMDAVLDVTENTPAPSSQSENDLKWDFAALNPQETKEISVTFNINSPVENPPVNGGTLLKYVAAISSAGNDETPEDNKSVLDQVVVNSFDPNDKTCVEGAEISQTKVGDYVHYVIRFENTGTYAAQNVTVKDIIDTAKYDINTLIPLSGSHLFATEITEGNKVAFKFENINLPFDDAHNDGYLAFKIKTKSSLVAGDTFGGSANIFFDYNSAITTNTPLTTISKSLGLHDFKFESHFILYPNPAETILHIDAKDSVELSSIQIYNTISQLIMVIPNAKNIKNIDVSSLSRGNYFLKIISNLGTSNAKFIKK